MWGDVWGDVDVRSSWDLRVCTMGKRYASVLPDPVAAAKVTDVEGVDGVLPIPSKAGRPPRIAGMAMVWTGVGPSM